MAQTATTQILRIMEIPPLGRQSRLNFLTFERLSESVLYSDNLIGQAAYPRLIEYAALPLQSEERLETNQSRLAG